MIALVTGASSGIGLMYARELASQGHDVILVSNQERELAETAESIINEFHVRTWAVYKDLSSETAPQELLDFCHENKLEVEILINNAGVFFFNYLPNVPMRKIELMLNLHILCVTRMVRLFGAEMAERGHGYILNMSSLSAWMSMPGIQCYNATKAYINNFSRSMWYELHPHGVNVLSVTPGAVDTGLYNLASNLRKLAVNIHVSIPPQKLAKGALKALYKGKKNYCPGFINRIFRPTIEHLPDWAVFFAMKKIDRFMK